uniref:Uncharacterized protein n=1 Tax=Romanomermis culicivorax TaxID=13658 RepID=A0A915J5Q2_ROMCU
MYPIKLTQNHKTIEELQGTFSIKNALFFNPNCPEIKDSVLTKQEKRKGLFFTQYALYFIGSKNIEPMGKEEQKKKEEEEDEMYNYMDKLER